MAKDKQKKKQASKSKAKKAGAVSAAKPASSAPKTSKVAKAAGRAKAKAVKLASNPAVAEVVAATLVAAAVALKNPKKARAMAAAVGDELEAASKQAIDRGSAFWQLALDIARRSIDALGSDKAAPKTKTGSKKKARK